MRPVDEMWEDFAFRHLDKRAKIEMGMWLNERYPEAEWSVNVNLNGSVTVTPKFKSAAEQTFYLLKWS